MPSLPALQAPLSDGVVGLRMSEQRDIPDVLIAYQDDRRLHHVLGERRPPSGAVLGRRAEEAEGERLAGRSITLTILEGGSDVCRGEVRVSEVEWGSGRAAIQIWVVPELRGRGLAARVGALAGRWLQESCGLVVQCRASSAEDVAG